MKIFARGGILLFLVALVATLIWDRSIGLAGQTSASETSNTTVSGDADGILVGITGLPSGMVASIYIDTPAPAGGFVRQRFVAAALHARVNAIPGDVVEAAPVIINDVERYQSTSRFQSVAEGTTSMSFAYEHDFMVIISRWSSGGTTADGAIDHVAGQVSMPTSWVRAGDSRVVTATPDAGWRFDHWGVFKPSEPIDRARISSTTSTLDLTVNGPVLLVAGFAHR